MLYFNYVYHLFLSFFCRRLFHSEIAVTQGVSVVVIKHRKYLWHVNKRGKKTKKYFAYKCIAIWIELHLQTRGDIAQELLQHASSEIRIQKSKIISYKPVNQERVKERAKMQLDEFDYFSLSATYARPYILQNP